MSSEPIAVTLQVVDALERLNVPYLIGGSLASAFHGVVRTTLDADLVAELRFEHVQPLVEALDSSFYIDAEVVTEAIHQRSSFNLIHLETMFKVDIFIMKQRPFDQAQFAHRTAQVISTNPERTAYVASAEDTILTKLEWYRLGGETSDRQWRDILGVIKVQENQLDLAYLRQWASELKVLDLLEKALAEAG
jgi:hypothetical protein